MTNDANYNHGAHKRPYRDDGSLDRKSSQPIRQLMQRVSHLTLTGILLAIR